MSTPVLPPTDRLVAALWRRGLVSSAMELARAALGRHDRRHAVLLEQLEALRAGEPLADHGGEPVTLDLDLVGAMVDRHRYHEARGVLRAVADEAGAAAEPLGELLDAALAPFPEEADPSYEALLQLIRVGQAPSALRALEEVMMQLSETPDWLFERQQSLASLVRGEWRNVLAPVAEVTRDTVLERLRARDLPGALAAAREAEAEELAVRLQRLLAAATDEDSEATVTDPDAQRTLPIEGKGMALFQVRMGTLSAADGSLRKLLRSDPDHEEIRHILADVIAVRQALGEDVDAMPPRSASVHWLNKRQPVESGGWARSSAVDFPKYGDYGDDEQSTDVLNAAHEAELLLKLGKTEQALDLYRLLAIRHPQSAAYRARIDEIEALIAHNLAPVAVEVTARHDLSGFIEKSLPTGHRLKIDARPTVRSVPKYDEDDDGGPTVVGEVPSAPDEDDDPTLS